MDEKKQTQFIFFEDSWNVDTETEDNIENK